MEAIRNELRKEKNVFHSFLDLYDIYDIYIYIGYTFSKANKMSIKINARKWGIFCWFFDEIFKKVNHSKTNFFPHKIWLKNNMCVLITKIIEMIEFIVPVHISVLSK